ncbi:TPA: hypothetical protein HA281_00550 [Candidatus Woesearchaeota archaeon]|nr:hypothetical protein [Candidatus Woesearchaeota archaeon]HIJ18314.1 hypothetical protein [Candidatus Woesearchaeota archaeon]
MTIIPAVLQRSVERIVQDARVPVNGIPFPAKPGKLISPVFLPLEKEAHSLRVSAKALSGEKTPIGFINAYLRHMFEVALYALSRVQQCYLSLRDFPPDLFSNGRMGDDQVCFLQTLRKLGGAETVIVSCFLKFSGEGILSRILYVFIVVIVIKRV